MFSRLAHDDLAVLCHLDGLVQCFKMCSSEFLLHRVPGDD
jgi:hypothetical protein